MRTIYKEAQFGMDEFELFRRAFKQKYPNGPVNKLLLHWWAYSIATRAECVIGREHVNMRYADDSTTQQEQS